VETFHFEGVREENLRLKARLDNPGILEVSASPVQHLTDGPFSRQRAPPQLAPPAGALAQYNSESL
jgi:hypothetical protein